MKILKTRNFTNTLPMVAAVLVGLLFLGCSKDAEEPKAPKQASQPQMTAAPLTQEEIEEQRLLQKQLFETDPKDLSEETIQRILDINHQQFDALPEEFRERAARLHALQFYQLSQQMKAIDGLRLPSILKLSDYSSKEDVANRIEALHAYLELHSKLTEEMNSRYETFNNALKGAVENPGPALKQTLESTDYYIDKTNRLKQAEREVCNSLVNALEILKGDFDSASTVNGRIAFNEEMTQKQFDAAIAGFYEAMEKQKQIEAEMPISPNKQ